ncbi:MAG: lysophospholipid acyltransferase family protein [Verrucomicrobiota bacterium]
MPRPLARAVLFALLAPLRAGYWIPRSYLRRAAGNFCHATDRPDPWPVFSRMIHNIQEAALQFARLHRNGRAGLLDDSALDNSVLEQLPQLAAQGRGVLVLVPHCAGAVLSSARLHAFHPTVLLVREPRQPGRRDLMLEYLRKLGPDFILVRNTPPATVMRQIVRALHDGKIVVGTTDLIHTGPDTVPTRIFGQPVHSPAWPARLSSRTGAPILPGYIHMDGNKIRLMAATAYVASDIDHGTQRWLSGFEDFFREYPSDWVFMLDKDWARVLTAAAESKKAAHSPASTPQESAHVHQRNRGAPQTGTLSRCLRLLGSRRDRDVQRR